MFVYHYALGIAAKGGQVQMLIMATISAYPLWTVLFQVIFAIVACPARIYQTAHGNHIPFFKLGYPFPYLDHLAHNFVTGSLPGTH